MSRSCHGWDRSNPGTSNHVEQGGNPESTPDHKGENFSEFEDSLEFVVSRSMTSTLIMEDATVTRRIPTPLPEDRSGSPVLMPRFQKRRRHEEVQIAKQAENYEKETEDTEEQAEDVEDNTEISIEEATMVHSLSTDSESTAPDGENFSEFEDSLEFVVSRSMTSTLIMEDATVTRRIPTPLPEDRSGSPVLMPRFQKRRRYEEVQIAKQAENYEKETEEQAEDVEDDTEINIEEATIVHCLSTDSESTAHVKDQIQISNSPPDV